MTGDLDPSGIRETAAPAAEPTEWTPEPTQTLAERVADQVDQFDPFVAMRLLETADPEHFPLAVRGAVTHRHVATPIARSAGGDAVEVNFVGLVGPLAVLPPVYTDLAVRARRQRNHAFAGFFDIFVSRLATLFTRAAEKYHLPSLVERHGPSGADAVTAALFAMIGVGLPALRRRMATPDHHLLPYAGLLSRDVRSAVGLEILLADHLGLPVRVEPFQRRWMPIAPEEQTRMNGATPAFGRLGVDAVAGAGIWDATSTFRVVIGPVGAADFESLAPKSSRLAEFCEIVRFYIDPGVDFDVQLVLRKEDVPEAVLGGATPAALGWNAWVRQLPMEKDADQAVFKPPS